MSFRVLESPPALRGCIGYVVPNQPHPNQVRVWVCRREGHDNGIVPFPERDAPLLLCNGNESATVSPADLGVAVIVVNPGQILNGGSRMPMFPGIPRVYRCDGPLPVDMLSLEASSADREVLRRHYEVCHFLSVLKRSLHCGKKLGRSTLVTAGVGVGSCLARELLAAARGAPQNAVSETTILKKTAEMVVSGGRVLQTTHLFRETRLITTDLWIFSSIVLTDSWAVPLVWKSARLSLHECLMRGIDTCPETAKHVFYLQFPNVYSRFSQSMLALQSWHSPLQVPPLPSEPSPQDTAGSLTASTTTTTAGTKDPPRWRSSSRSLSVSSPRRRLFSSSVARWASNARRAADRSPGAKISESSVA